MGRAEGWSGREGESESSEASGEENSRRSKLMG